jgi:hypothetical protein
MDRWLPGYEHDPEPGAGLDRSPGAPKVVIHTTESGPGSLARVRGTWRGQSNWGRGLPHFIAEGDRYVQLLPLDVGAYTLENKPGGADTNRCGPAIQVEIVGFARDGFTDVEYDALGRWLAELVKAGVPLDLGQHPRFYGEDAGFTLASYDARQRMGHDEYHDFAGFCGHQHVPENAHWDPGHLDGDRVERIARAHLAKFIASWMGDDMYHLIIDGRPGQLSAWLLCGLEKRWLPSTYYADLLARLARDEPQHIVDHGMRGGGDPWIALLDLAAYVPGGAPPAKP